MQGLGVIAKNPNPDEMKKGEFSMSRGSVGGKWNLNLNLYGGDSTNGGSGNAPKYRPDVFVRTICRGFMPSTVQLSSTVTIKGHCHNTINN